MPDAGDTEMPIFVTQKTGLTDHGGVESEWSEAAKPQGQVGGGRDELSVQGGHTGEKATGRWHSGKAAWERTA